MGKYCCSWWEDGPIPIYVKFWWPLFLGLKFTFLFLELANIKIFIPKSAYGGGEIIPKNLTASQGTVAGDSDNLLFFFEPP